ncbi:MAG TPA: cellulase N-terminal Ig-like domain-containing protein, partial [Cytophagales bacterium]|nr:cellulase N-terminal Ig-like domain-containing protein [Cytophagales bacterium]
MNRFLKLALSFMGVVGLYAQPNNNIRLNQVGFFVNGPKVAAVIGSAETAFTVKSVDRSIVYHTGTLSAASTWAQSGESVKTADFSSFNTPGSYVLEVPNLGYSYTFTIKDDAFVNLNRGLVKAFYFNRTSTALPQQYAGQWARSAGHPDNQLVVHPSAASAQRPAG